MVLEAVEQIEYALRYAPEELKAENEVVLGAIKLDGGALD